MALGCTKTEVPKTEAPPKTLAEHAERLEELKTLYRRYVERLPSR